MSDLYHTLDYNGLYDLAFDYFPDSQHVDVEITEKGQPWSRFKQSVMGQLRVVSMAGEEVAGEIIRVGSKLRFTKLPEEFLLKMGDETIGHYRQEGGRLQKIGDRLITAFETRRVGTFHGDAATLYHQPEDPELVGMAKHAITTDYHTHSSGQISADGLLSIAEKHALHYPIHLLVEAGILTRDQCDESRFQPWGREKRVLFPPLEPQLMPKQRWAVYPTDDDLEQDLMPVEVATVPVAALTPDERFKLAQMMCLSADRQNTHTEMEYNAYRYRYPIAKKPEVLEDNLRTIAKEYAAQGINYAEISYVGLDNPKLLAALHRLVPEIEAETGVRLRFMVGIPRNWPIEQIQNTLTKTRILAQSPYITGVDFLGYEVNKTDRFSEALEDLVRWADEKAHGFIIRAHAGENDKNPENIKQLLQLTSKYKNVRTRIGHGLYGLDDETLQIAKSMNTDPENPRLVIEFNPDSNMALNNIDDTSQVPFAMALRHNLPFVIGSDCSGIYQTTAEQLGLASLYAGLNKHDFETLKRHQTNITDAQLATAQERADAIENWDSHVGKNDFVKRLEAQLGVVEMIAQPRVEVKTYDEERAVLRDQGKLIDTSALQKAALGDRLPIAVVGASGSNWDRISPAERETVKVAIDMLTHVLDPEKAYILQGRTKNSGLSKLVSESSNQRNRDMPETQPLKILGMVAQPEYDRQDSFDMLTHMIEIPGELMDVPDAIVDHVVAHRGVIVAAGGAAFTRNIITKADYKMKEEDRGALMLMDGPEGASTDKAGKLNPHYRVQDGREIITRLFNLYGRDLFVEGFNPLAAGVLDKLEQASHARVANYHVETPSAQDQRVVEGITLVPEQQRML